VLELYICSTLPTTCDSAFFRGKWALHIVDFLRPRNRFLHFSPVPAWFSLFYICFWSFPTILHRPSVLPHFVRDCCSHPLTYSSAGYRSMSGVMATGQTTWTASANVRGNFPRPGDPFSQTEPGVYVASFPSDLRGKFSAIHREYSPNPRKFYAFCTSVTDTATTAGIIASGELLSSFLFFCIISNDYFLFYSARYGYSATLETI